MARGALMRVLNYNVLLETWDAETRTLFVELTLIAPSLPITMPADSFTGDTPTEEEVRLVADPVVEGRRAFYPDPAVSMQYSLRNQVITPQEI